MRYRTPKNIVVLAGGVVAGVAAMYLLDPAAGRRRREAIASAANSAVHHAGDAIYSAGDAVRDAAVTAGEKIGDIAARARRGGEHAIHAAAEAVTAATEAPASVFGPTTAATAIGMHRLVNSYHDSAHYLADRLDRLRGALDTETHTHAHAHRALHAGQALLAPVMMQAKSALSRFGGKAATRTVAKRSLLLIPIGVGGVACLAAGAGAMYLFDPDRGRHRRSEIREELVGAVRKIGHFARRRGRNVRNHVEGVAREVGLTSQPRISSRDYVSGEQLLLRVRAEIVRVSGTPRMIQVMTDSFGEVTLHGEIIDSERQPILTAVRRTPGVRHVVDRLRVQSTPGATPSAAQSAS
jgi:gas vesicle protein